MNNCGIYCITCLANGKRYIGSSKELNIREKSHFKCLRGQYHHNKYLQAAFNKYGEYVFNFEILKYCSEADLLQEEAFYIAVFNSADRNYGYNLIDRPHRPIFSDETKQKISDRQLGSSNSFYGKTHTEETRKKISQAGIGNKSNTGRKLTEEHKKNISKGGKGVHRNAEACINIGLGRKKYWAERKLKEQQERERGK